MDDRGKLAEERKMIFANLANGVGVPEVMAAFQKSEKEVLAIFDWVAKKVAAYRFERGLPFTLCKSIDDARRQQATVLHTLERLNLKVDPKFNIIQLPIDPTVPGMSEAEMRIIQHQSRMAS